MNKRQLEVEKKKLADEAYELKQLKAIYNKAAEDIAKNISITDGKMEVLLQNWDDLSDDDKSVYQSKIYQRNYQKQLQKQINDVLKDLNSGQYKSIDEYLKKCYETGFIGSMYDIAGQGIPIISPIDQKKVIKAMKTNSKISGGLYTKLGEDVDVLKKRIANNISRGIASGDSYKNIARNIANDSNVGFNNAMRIARTEGHRIHCNSAFDAQMAAKDAGADIVKQWDATMDGKTRPHHRLLDGQIREVEEPFNMGGMKPMYPADFGRPEEDINCRCALLQRATWALDEDELETLRERAKQHELYITDDDKESFRQNKGIDLYTFQKRYLKATAEPLKKSIASPVTKINKKSATNSNNSGIIKTVNTSDAKVFDGLISNQTGMTKDYKKVLKGKFAKGKSDAKKVFNKFVPSHSVAVSTQRGTAHFNRATQKVYMDYADDLQNARGAGTTFFHEHGHYIDFVAAGTGNAEYLSTNNAVFGTLLRSDFDSYVSKVKKDRGYKNKTSAYADISFEIMGDNMHSVSDIVGGLTKGRCQGSYGHKRSYWNNVGTVEKEAFAHMYEAMFDPDKYKLMNQYFPKAFKEFRSMLKGLV